MKSYKTRLCKLCGDEFKPASGRQFYCKNIHFRPCHICAAPAQVLSLNDNPTCVNCKDTVKARGAESRRRTNLQKYGAECVFNSEHWRVKSKETCNEKYGTDNPMQSPDIQKRQQESTQRSCGVPFALQSSKSRAKLLATVIKKYGVNSTYHIRSQGSTKSKASITMYDLYGSEIYSQTEEWRAKVSKTNMELYGVPYFCMHERCQQANSQIVSKLNIRVKEMIETFGYTVYTEVNICKSSYDLYIPRSKMLIELNPTYTHNLKGNHWHPNGLPIDYHRNKTLLAESYGYNCIHIFDWDNLDQLVNSLQPKTTIYARKCVISEIDIADVHTFLSDYHFQGSCRGQTTCYGLYYQGELVQVMTFGKPRYNKNYEWELLRLCSAPNYKVVGGAERLLSMFIKINRPLSILTYCDRSKFKGEVYSRLGFSLVSEGSVSRHWYNERSKKHITDNLLRQRGFDQLFGTNFGKGSSNEELMIQHGWLPVGDCGQASYHWSSN